MGRTVEAAIADGARKLGADPSRTQYEIIEAPKKGFLGFGEAPAKVRVYVEDTAEEAAEEETESKNFVQKFFEKGVMLGSVKG